MARPKSAKASGQSSATIGFEAKLWLTADKPLSGQGDYDGTYAEDPGECKAFNLFWVPAKVRLPHLQSSAKQSRICRNVDNDAMVAIERDNPRLKGVLPKDYARVGLDKLRIDELIDLIATIELTATSVGEPGDEKMSRLAAELQSQFAESAKLAQASKANLKGLGYGK